MNLVLSNSRCESGLLPLPDSIQGCVECIDDYNCNKGYTCEKQWNKCIAKPDPCDPSPCGSGTICRVDPYGKAVCRFFSSWDISAYTNHLMLLLALIIMNFAFF